MRAAIEALERRSLMSVSVAGGVLTVRGTAGDDAIHMQELVEVATGQPVSFVISGQPELIPAAGVRRIVVRAGAGNDLVDLNLSTSLAAGDAAGVSLPA